MAGKRYIYQGNAPEVEVTGVGIVKQGEPFTYEGELNNPDFAEAKTKSKKEEGLEENN